MKIAIIGGGAAGCFAAIEIKRRMPEAQVTVFEGGKKPLAKVAVTGGGRCNLTNSFEHVKSIESVYPRGARIMKRLLREFGHENACRRFEHEGVKLFTQNDGCVFPASQDAMEIVNTLTRLMHKNGVCVKTGHRVCRITADEKPVGSNDDKGKFALFFNGRGNNAEYADSVIVTTGGCSKRSGTDFLNALNLEIIEPAASLFSMCIPDSDITELTGIVVNNVSATLVGTKLRASGPLLVTHWGMSGPAILRLSSYAARILHDNNYRAKLSINWFGGMTVNEVMETIREYAVKNERKQVRNVYPEQLNSRLWLHLLRRGNLRQDMRWNEMTGKRLNKLAAVLTDDTYNIDGKNRFKDEFVTCGGVALNNVSASTLECKTCPRLYFAGEVLDIDAVTGGFNLQAAWTTGYITAKSVTADKS